jgi:hypothetical protein
MWIKEKVDERRDFADKIGTGVKTSRIAPGVRKNFA